MAKTHYDVLGLKRTSSSQEIRSAFRKIVLEHHPDRSNQSASKEKFLAATAAYEVLGDSDRRSAYDESLILAERRAAARAQAPKSPVSRPAPAPRQRSQAGTSQSPISADLTRLTLLLTRGRLSDAETLAREIIERDSRQALAYAVLGDILRGRGELREATKMYAYAAQMDGRNPLYQQRYEQLLDAISLRKGARVMSEQNGASALIAPCIGFAIIVVACVYPVTSPEVAFAPWLKLISSWTVGLLVMMFLAGVAIGSSLSIGKLVDRFNGVQTNSLGRLSPSMTLATIAIVNFWAAAFVYIVLGFIQKAFTFSTSRLIGSVAFVTLLMSASVTFSHHILGTQVLFWGGNVIYVGALSGWMVADSIRV